MLACLAGKLLGALISGGIGSVDCGEAPNDLQSAVVEEVHRRSGSVASNVVGVVPRESSKSRLHGSDTASGSTSAGSSSIASSGGGSAPGSSTVEREWLESPLLANGLIVHPAGAFASGMSASASAIAAATAGNFNIVGMGMIDDGAGGMGPTGSGAIEVFLRELVEGAQDSPALALSQWVSKHVGENPILARTGGPLVARGVRGAAAAMLWHSGYAAAAQRMATALAGAPAAARTHVDSQVNNGALTGCYFSGLDIGVYY